MSACSHRDWFERDPSFAHVQRELRDAGLGATLARLDAQPPQPFARPAAPEFALNIFLSSKGRSAAVVGGERLYGTYRRHDAVVVAADCDVWIENPDPLSGYVLLLPRAELVRSFPEQPAFQSGDAFGALHAGLFRDETIASLIERLWTEAAVGADSMLFRDQIVTTIAAGLLSISGRAARRADRRLDPTDWRLRRAIEVLEAQLTDDIGLIELAALVDLTPQRLTALFREAIGEPPHRYRTRRRVERGCELLADPRQSITEIAHACGFASSQHFATVFKRRVGVTPTEYRRERVG